MKLCMGTLCYEKVRLLWDVCVVSNIVPRVGANISPLLTAKEEKLVEKVIAKRQKDNAKDNGLQKYIKGLKEKSRWILGKIVYYLVWINKQTQLWYNEPNNLTYFWYSYNVYNTIKIIQLTHMCVFNMGVYFFFA